MFHQDLEDLLYLKDYTILERSLSAISLPNPRWTSGLLMVAISKRLELQGRGCTRLQDNSK